MKYMKFAPELVPLVQDGTKTVTRRPIKPQPELVKPEHANIVNEAWQDGWIDVPCPYGIVGDTIQSDAGPLEIVGVKVEWLHHIDPEDVIKEGFSTNLRGFTAEVELVRQFAEKWESFYNVTDYHWDANPSCWVIEFKAVTE
jgi:hypothetical protein